MSQASARDGVPAMTGATALPPLVADGECELLRQRTADVAAGRAVLLHVGGPVEADGQIGREAVREQLRTLTQMQVILTYVTGLPVVKVGLIAGAYHHQAAALNLVRALTAGLGPDLGEIPWGSAGAQVDARHRDQMSRIARGLAFLKGYGLTRLSRGGEVFAGHDCPGCAGCATAGHLLWLDAGLTDPDRLDALVRAPNALAIRLGVEVEPDRILRLIDWLDPCREPGRLTFVAGMASDLLPPLVEKVRATGAEVCWVGDPGPFEPGARLRAFVEALRSVGAHPGGAHVTVSGPRGAALDLVLDLADALKVGARTPPS
ncbi:3-deoxy-7-phosphoheptulonate synthase [Micromonospora sp. NPDC005298]|uniref:3-deoxy-7-phosphoheptulonate synthase n=1 Tax=Micromonospora sp. NPDC005298 TaxID=3156873 RepID=UPI0033BEB05F